MTKSSLTPCNYSVRVFLILILEPRESCRNPALTGSPVYPASFPSPRSCLGLAPCPAHRHRGRKHQSAFPAESRGVQRRGGGKRGEARSFFPLICFFFFLLLLIICFRCLFCCVSLQVLTTFLIQGARRPRPLFLVQRHHLWTVLPTSVAGNAELRATAGITRGQRAMSGSQS